MLIPIGHEESEVRRLPWVSIVIGVSCILVFWLTGRAEDRAREQTNELLAEAVQYYYQHDYLEPGEELAGEAEWWYPEDEEYSYEEWLGEAGEDEGEQYAGEWRFETQAAPAMESTE